MSRDSRFTSFVFITMLLGGIAAWLYRATESDESTSSLLSTVSVQDEDGQTEVIVTYDGVLDDYKCSLRRIDVSGKCIILMHCGGDEAKLVACEN